MTCSMYYCFPLLQQHCSESYKLGEYHDNLHESQLYHSARFPRQSNGGLHRPIAEAEPEIHTFSASCAPCTNRAWVGVRSEGPGVRITPNLLVWRCTRRACHDYCCQVLSRRESRLSSCWGRVVLPFNCHCAALADVNQFCGTECLASLDMTDIRQTASNYAFAGQPL
ncbi:hypothetical protein BC629DRAFT_156883 [Irpex lacteus]|nr:hypothetical protein BC629DRAFT_156883 [Irpex lacteus]